MHTLNQKPQDAWRNRNGAMDKKEMYKKIEKNMYAMFVDNLPFAMPTSWLW